MSEISSSYISYILARHVRNRSVADMTPEIRTSIKALRSDSLAVFSAAKGARKMAEYLLGLERQVTTMKDYAEWDEEYDAALARW